MTTPTASSIRNAGGEFFITLAMKFLYIEQENEPPRRKGRQDFFN
jgi:hypothetical protein